MPISKSNALQNAVERDASDYASFCELIDGAIKQRAGTPLQITVAIGKTPSQVVDRAIAEYRSIGWDCERISDQREGDYLHLQ